MYKSELLVQSCNFEFNYFIHIEKLIPAESPTIIDMIAYCMYLYIHISIVIIF